MNKIENLQDVVNNYEKLRNLEFHYIDGSWTISSEDCEEVQKIDDKRFPITMVNCGLLTLDSVVMSHHAYRTYKLSNILSSKDITHNLKLSLYNLITMFQEKRTFSSIRKIEDYLEEHEYETSRTEIPNFASYWSSYKYDRAFIIKDTNTWVKFALRYYAIVENLTKKNQIVRHFLRTARNLFYPEIPFPYVPRLGSSKYYTPIGEGSSGYTFNKELWEKDYKEFEETIIKRLKEDIN